MGVGLVLMAILLRKLAWLQMVVGVLVGLCELILFVAPIGIISMW
jgi:hypothetical protein